MPSHPSHLWEPVVGAAASRRTRSGDTHMPVELPEQDLDALAAAIRDGGGDPTHAPVDRPTATWDDGDGRFVVVGRIDDGGMASVLLARQVSLGRDVAVKVLKKGRPYMDRLLFRSEALTTAYLEHPCIIPVHDAVDDGIVMRRVHGKTLSALIPPMPPQDNMAANLAHFLHVCEAIAYAHGDGVIHRDIKADNILVGDRDGSAVVVDWGLSMAVGPGRDGKHHAPRVTDDANVCSGTPACLPPEVARGEASRVGLWTDTHMLGGLLYNILTGMMPYEEDDQVEALDRAAASRRATPRAVNPHVPAILDHACLMAMDPDVERRGDIGDLVGAIMEWLEGDGRPSRRSTMGGKRMMRRIAPGSRHRDPPAGA